MAALSMVFEKIASKDKDYRYMATSDLLNELQKDTFHTDAETERKICAVRSHAILFPAPHPVHRAGGPWRVAASAARRLHVPTARGRRSVCGVAGMEGTQGGFEGRRWRPLLASAPAVACLFRPLTETLLHVHALVWLARPLRRGVPSSAQAAPRTHATTWVDGGQGVGFRVDGASSLHASFSRHEERACPDDY